jgi:hypothetical protein
VWHVTAHDYAGNCIRHHSEYVPEALARSLFDDLPQGAVDRAQRNALQQANIMNSMSKPWDVCRLLTSCTVIFPGLFHFRPGRSVGLATGSGLDGPGIESRWGRDFPHLSRPALGPPSLL